jgi:hypothetical protein
MDQIRTLEIEVLSLSSVFSSHVETLKFQIKLIYYFKQQWHVTRTILMRPCPTVNHPESP